MRLEKEKNYEKKWKILGFTFMYLLFTLVLYFIIKLLWSLPKQWTFFHVIAITLGITLLGGLIKKWLNGKESF